MEKSLFFTGAVAGAVFACASLLTGCGGGSVGSSTTSIDAQAVEESMATIERKRRRTTGSISLTWSAPSTNVDGTAVTDLAGYVISYGTSPGNLATTISVPGASATGFVVRGVAVGTYYVAVAALNTAGVASDPSNYVVATVP